MNHQPNEPIPTTIVDEAECCGECMAHVPQPLRDIVKGAPKPQQFTLMRERETGAVVQAWVVMVDPRIFHPDMLGLIPSFFDPRVDTPIIEQIDANYQHGGGWRNIAAPHGSLTLEQGFVLKSPGERAYQPIASCSMCERDEKVLVVVFESGMTAVVAADGSYQVARLD
jgi:hypothetical protein